MPYIRNITKASLWALVLGPAFFVFFASQHAAITAPFWDHCEFGRLLVRIHYGDFHFSDLWAPHNQARPLLFRVLLIVNARLTDWDIRSEYIYLYAAMYSGFLVLAYGLWRSAERRTDVWFLCLLAMISVLFFSPVGHNNHWYSMQLLYQLTNTFLIIAFVVLCLAPNRWAHNLWSALACWAASYGTANGLPGFVCCAAVAQLGSERPSRINRSSVFWLANIVLVLALYLPGLPTFDAPWRPRPSEMLWFALIYLGLPVEGLIRYPYVSMFAPPAGTALWRGLTGLGMCVFAGVLVWILRQFFHRLNLSALLFLSFTLYALTSSILTAWGRATLPPLGIAWASSSRYSMYAAYLAFGILFLLAGIQRACPLDISGGRSAVKVARGAAIVAFIAFVSVAVRSYANSVVVYRDAHEFNRRLEAAFASEKDDDDGVIYPSRAVAAQLKRDLRSLRLGPYRYSQQPRNPLLLTLGRNSLEDQFGINGVRSDPQLGLILFAHPRSRYYLPLDKGVRSVRAVFGISGTALGTSPKTDGVEFRLILEQRGAPATVIWSRYLDPVGVTSDRGQQTLDLSIVPANGSRLIFETNPGGSTTADWAYWTGVQLR